MKSEEKGELTEEQVNRFLSEHSTGVLSLAQGDKPYSAPISYGYDAETRRFCMRLVAEEGSEKRDFVSSASSAQLVIYDSHGETYRSVVVKGSLEEVTREFITEEHIERFGDAKRPVFEMCGAEESGENIFLYELEPDIITGRAATSEMTVEVGEEPNLSLVSKAQQVYQRTLRYGLLWLRGLRRLSSSLTRISVR